LLSGFAAGFAAGFASGFAEGFVSSFVEGFVSAAAGFDSFAGAAGFAGSAFFSGVAAFGGEQQVSRLQVPSSEKLSVQVEDFDSSHKQEQFARQLSNRHTLRPGRLLKTHLSSSGRFEQRPFPAAS